MSERVGKYGAKKRKLEGIRHLTILNIVAEITKVKNENEQKEQIGQISIIQNFTAMREHIRRL